MYCRRCRTKLKIHNKYCPNCGLKNNYISGLIKSFLTTGILMLSVFIVSYHFTNSFYHDDKSEVKETTSSKTKQLSKYETIIEVDRTYHGVKISSKEDAVDLIKKDSTTQKNTCSKDILQLENYLIKNYKITAVNLCEMDYSLAYELNDVIGYIYKNYPKSRGYLTNLTLKNMSVEDNTTIAAFLPTFQFATASSLSTYPWVYKTQIFLNSSYFLNENKLENTVISSSESGHFPKNANKFSPVAHEMGHYLSFIVLMKHYKLGSIIRVNSTNQDKLVKVIEDYNEGKYSKKLLIEAYNKYLKSDNAELSFDVWRSTISGYALTKDTNDQYIYDETIAEAFHDVYLNGKYAAPASAYIIYTLKQKLEEE